MNLRDELLKIRDASGALTPEAVKEAARPKDHPLHSVIFDKPVKEAAEAYYTARAHQVIRIARIRFPTIDPQDRRTIRAFQAVRSSEGDTPQYVYEPTEEVVLDPVAMEMLLREMERDWRQLKTRYEHLEEFRAMVARELESVE